VLKSIKIKEETKKKLDERKATGQSYDGIIQDLIKDKRKGQNASKLP
jgi:predicted CopG family antitoxin